MTAAGGNRSGLGAGWIAAIVGVAVLARLGYLAAVHAGPESLLAADSTTYLGLGAQAEAWLRSGFAAGDWLPDPARLPLYPLFLGAVRVLTGSADPLYPVLAQIGLDVLTCAVVGGMAASLRPRLGPVAGLAAALNPSQIVFAGLILTDTLFLALVALMLALALRWIGRPRAASALGIGVLGGLALLTRAVIWPFLLVLPLALLALGWWRHRRLPAAHAALLLAAAAAFAAPVLARNWSDHGVVQLSSQGGEHTLYWVVPLVREAKDGTPYAASVAELQRRVAARHPGFDRLDPFARSRAMMAEAVDALRELGAAAFARATLWGAAINLLSPAAILSPPVAALPRTGFYATAGDGVADKIRNFLLRNDNATYARVLVASLAVEAALRLVQLGGLIALARDAGARPALALLLLWAAFILAINGPVASAKYRLPIEPVLSVLLAGALARPGARR